MSNWYDWKFTRGPGMSMSFKTWWIDEITKTDTHVYDAMRYGLFTNERKIMEDKGCPVCGSKPKIIDRLITCDDPAYTCVLRKYGILFTLDEWNGPRPLEDKLRTEIVALQKTISEKEGIDHQIIELWKFNDTGGCISRVADDIIERIKYQNNKIIDLIKLLDNSKADVASVTGENVSLRRENKTLYERRDDYERCLRDIWSFVKLPGEEYGWSISVLNAVKRTKSAKESVELSLSMTCKERDDIAAELTKLRAESVTRVMAKPKKKSKWHDYPEEEPMDGKELIVCDGAEMTYFGFYLRDLGKFYFVKDHQRPIYGVKCWMYKPRAPKR